MNDENDDFHEDNDDDDDNADDDNEDSMQKAIVIWARLWVWVNKTALQSQYLLIFLVYSIWLGSSGGRLWFYHKWINIMIIIMNIHLIYIMMTIMNTNHI